jgi:hypothetical protein
MGYAPSSAAAGPALPAEAYTPWLTRVLAWLIDFIPVAILEGIGWGLLLGTRETACITDTSEYDLGEFWRYGRIDDRRVHRTCGIVALAYWSGISAIGRAQRLEHRQVDHEVQDCQRKDRTANRFRNVHCARAYLPDCFACGILGSPSCSRCGSQATDAG